MKRQYDDFPLEIHISFHKIIEIYEERLESEQSSISKQYIENILEYVSSFPKLRTGLTNFEEVRKYIDPVRILLDDLFPSILTTNEIKAASVPFHNIIFNASTRFANILKDAGEDFYLKMRNIEEDMSYIYACIVILGKHYGYKIDFSRPLYYDIPDKDGLLRHYRIAMNADFVDFEPTEMAKEISQEDVEVLIQNVDDIDLWKEKFPPKSWIFRGFTILNLTDVTIDDAISQLKTALLSNSGLKEVERQEQFAEIFQSIYGIKDLRVGFTVFDEKEGMLERMENGFATSYILNKESEMECETVMCDSSYQALVEEKTYFSLANVEKYAEATSHNLLSENLLSKDVNSCILAPVAKDGKLLGILELVSYRKNELNSVNATKLDDILPYIITAVERNKVEVENRIKAIIQSECTSIHPSVLWIFEREARQFIREYEKNGIANFRDIAFDDVYPLYGQIDIVGSSTERNAAIEKDLTEQLNLVSEIMGEAYKDEPATIYDQISMRLQEFREDIQENLSTTSENKVFNLMKREIYPVLKHIKKQNNRLRDKINDYFEQLDEDSGSFYKNRRDYDSTVQKINKGMARLIDKRQKEAQNIYPHYFDRYKTDGVDHNIYIGAEMAQNKPFDKVYLYNLRLWQLRTMCEMENKFYQMQEELPLSIDAASLILVFNSTLSIRYRMDEKKFDVDGTYNARYEIIKKRIDKASIKGTEERVTTKGKIAIIYSQSSDEKEYERYISYLQAKGYLGKSVEYLELEDVQGVIGLKALRVEVLYTKAGKDNAPRKDTVTYEDLMNELN